MKKIFTIFGVVTGIIIPAQLFAQTQLSAPDPMGIPTFISADANVVSVKPSNTNITIPSPAVPVHGTSVSATGNAQLFTKELRMGMTDNQIKDLQEILKSDPSIYPEGIVSGYYGTLTAEAIKRLQARYGIPVTGVLDSATIQILYPPNVELAIISPNGGEVWNKSGVQTITWRTYTGPVILNGRQVLNQYDSSTNALSSGTTAPIKPDYYPYPQPFFKKAVLELVQDSNPSFRYHIGTVDLYQSVHNWQMPARIPVGHDYRVRISVGSNVPCAYRREASGVSVNNTITDAMTNSSATTAHAIAPGPCPLMPAYSVSDTSDAPFTIAGTQPPPDDVINKLKASFKALETTANTLLRQIQSINTLLNSL